MKKLFFILAAVMISFAANAQIVSSRSSVVTKSASEYPNYSRFGINYASMKYTAHGESTDALNGVQLHFIKGMNIVPTLPLYLETGIQAQYNQYEQDYGYYDDDESTYIHVDASIPVNVSYRYTHESGLYVAPYAGVNLAVNILDDFCDEDLKRVQFGGQIGLNVGYKAFNVNIGYVTSLTNICEEINTNSFLVGIGFNF